MNKHFKYYFFLSRYLVVVVIIANSVPNWLFWDQKKTTAYEDITTINGVNLEMWDLFQM